MIQNQLGDEKDETSFMEQDEEGSIVIQTIREANNKE